MFNIVTKCRYSHIQLPLCEHKGISILWLSFDLMNKICIQYIEWIFPCIEQKNLNSRILNLNIYALFMSLHYAILHCKINISWGCSSVRAKRVSECSVIVYVMQSQPRLFYSASHAKIMNYAILNCKINMWGCSSVGVK